MKKLISILTALSIAVTMLSFATVAYAGVPKGAKSYKGHRYYVYNDASSWADAKRKCEKRGGHLATITSQGENDAIYNYIIGLGVESAFFGLTDESKEGTWKWVTGEKVKYTNWHSGEPNSEDEYEDYGMFYYEFTDGTWNDGEFNEHSAYYICEWDFRVVLSESSVTLNVGEKTTVEYTVKGMKTDKKPTWKSSNTDVAKVSSKGKIIAMGVGSCTVTCKVGDAKATVKVIVRPEQVQNFKAVKVSRKEITFNWSKQKNVDGYRIYVYDEDLEEYTYVKGCDGAFKSTTVKKLKPGKTYKFKIRSYINVKGEKYYGKYSKVITVKTKR